MKASVLAIYRSFTQRFEGIEPFMYGDIKSLVTTGAGDLIDPMSEAIGLEWLRNIDGLPASPSEIAFEWRYIKSRTDLAHLGGGAFKPPVTTLHLSDAAIEHLIQKRLLNNEGFLRQRFPAWDSWPADAQLGTMSNAWAAGPLWKAPRFDQACKNLDFDFAAGPIGDANLDSTCRGEAWLNDTGNPGLRPRNLANKVCFWNAARVTLDLNDRCDPEVLYYPVELTPGTYEA